MSPKLTPETLLSLPRPGGALPSPDGSYYLLPYSHFDFASGRTTRNVSLGRIPRAHSTPAASSSSPGEAAAPPTDLLANLRYPGAVWLDDDSVLYLRPRGAESGKEDVDVKLSDKAFKKRLAKEEDDDDHKPGMEVWCKTLEGREYRVGELPVE